MTNKVPDLIIRNELDALNVLQLAVDNKLPEYDKLLFEGWPTLSLYLKGDKFDQSLTPTVMKGLIELQRGIYRSYALAKFNNPSKRLSDEEKEDFEIEVRVNGGSSDLEINYTDIAVKLVEQIGSRVNPTEVVIAVVTIALAYFGKTAYDNYLENRKEIKIKEISDETQKKTLEAMTFMSTEETKRAEVMASLANQDATIRAITELATETHGELIRALATGSHAKIGGTNLPTEIAETLTQNTRRTSSEVRLDGEYRLVKADWSMPSASKVKVINPKTGLELNAVLQDDSLTGAYKDAIRTAGWSRQLLKLSINAKKIGNSEYSDVVIFSAELVN